MVQAAESLDDVQGDRNLEKRKDGGEKKGVVVNKREKLDRFG